MDDRRAGAKITNFPGATMCFMQMNDERIFNVFILQVSELDRSVACQ